MKAFSRPVAEVAVALPLAGTFSYLVPPELEADLAPGTRVLVPFGPRQVTGYVLDRVGAEERPGPEIELREVLAPLDAEPLFGPDLVSFFRFIAEYYHYPLGLVIAEALPAGLKAMSWRTAVLTPAGRRALDQGRAGPEEARLLARLGRGSGLTLARLAREKGADLKTVRRLARQGWVAVETRLYRERVRPRRETWLSPVVVEETGPGRVRLGPREQELCALLASRGSTPAAELRGRFPTLPAMIRRLKAKGRLRVEKREVFRDALGRALHFEPQAPELTAEQARAAAALNQALTAERFAPFLLYGVTGSGKTEVYLAAVARALALGRTVLLLVPEISLTPALEGLLRARFGREVAVLHSGLSEAERYGQWLKVRRGEVSLVLGARSGVFAPLENLGLIVVDEEHDPAYKQEDKLRYQARDLALVRGRESRAVVVLGSATPSLESFHHARSGRYRLLSLNQRLGGGTLPRVDVVDLRFGSGRRRGALTPVLKKALEETLGRGEQALLFLNRRGLAGLPLCLACGHVIKCLNCSVSLTLHQGPGGETLSCHYCGLERPRPQRCPACDSPLFRYLGLGTEKLEAEVAKAFPQARVGRLDADTARPKGALTRILEGLKEGSLDIVVGTQIVTKGHDFPNITLVGVIEADLGLHRPDFRAGERTFQLLSQVSGRAGRGPSPGRVIIQTLSPEHYSLLRAKRHDYLGFFEEELAERRLLGYPPFSRLLLARLSGNSEEKTRALAEEAAALGRELLQGVSAGEVELLGPAPAPLAKVKGKYRYQILVRGGRVRPLHRFLEEWLARLRPRLKGRGVALSADVDPHDMM